MVNSMVCWKRVCVSRLQDSCQTKTWFTLGPLSLLFIVDHLIKKPTSRMLQLLGMNCLLHRKNRRCERAAREITNNVLWRILQKVLSGNRPADSKDFIHNMKSIGRALYLGVSLQLLAGLVKLTNRLELSSKRCS